MSERSTPATRAIGPTRRRMITGVAAAFGSLAAGSAVWGKAQQTMAEPPSTGADKLRTSLHQEIDLPASPHRIYAALLDSKTFAAFSGAAAVIDPALGGAFSMFDGQITGRNVELVPDERIVQAWRPGSWAPGVYSIAKFEFRPQGSQTKVILDHTGFPEGKFAGLDSGWYDHYWNPLKKYFA
ncbi:MAG: SRPBCC domain-containing protein [Candidatus Acidiferrales bacterium]